MFKRGDIALAHQWQGKYAEYNGEAVTIVGDLRLREAHNGSGAHYKLEAYGVLTPDGERIVCAPRNLLPLYEPMYRFRVDLDTVFWDDCVWQPKELSDGKD